MDIKRIKALISLAVSVQEADSLIEKTGFYTVHEKLAFLKGAFSCNIVNRDDENGIIEGESKEMDYYALLSTIIL